MRELPEALAPLRAYSQFVAFVLVPSKTRPGKTDKFPISCATMTVASAHDPAAWGTFEQALAVADLLGPGHGVGFVLTDADPFWFLDIDGCLQGGQWTPLAHDLMARTAGAAIEVSSSGAGLHIIGTSPAPVVGFKHKNAALGLEFYTGGRFIALTGISTSGSAAFCPPGLAAAVAAYFEPAGAGMASADWTSGPVVGWNGPTEDVDLIERAYRSQSAAGAFSSRASFANLWDADVAAMAATWPDPTNAGRPYDASSADAALAQHLAFWTGNDCERIKRLMFQSGLVRDKWQRDDYIERTILGACSRQTVWCDIAPRTMADPQLVEPVEPVQPGAAVTHTGGHTAEQRVGVQFLGLEQQQQYFAGCVYVLKQHVVRTPAGALLKPEQFKAFYGGYSFAMDARNVRTVRNAWEAFVENQGLRWPRVDDLAFRPDLAPGAILEDQGQTFVNSWIPIDVPRHPGDAGPFLRHMEKLLPNAHDRELLLCYMAAIVQHKGVKFQWCPLVQGVPGNGKTLLSRCVAEAIGQRYVHFPKASEIADKFNDWLYGKIFIAVEDIYVPDSAREVLEELKPMITGERQEIQGKGKDKETRSICCNLMLNSNIKNAIHKTRNDRRFAPFFTAQQTPEDLQRDGMTSTYFSDLYSWLRGDGRYAGQPSGYAIVTDLLHTYPIPAAMNPAALCQTAPITSSTDEAIQAGAGRIEQEVIEAIECGLPGFCGGWVSSMALDRLIEQMRVPLPRNRRREILEELGYIRHPGLADGRVNNVIQPDNGKPRLYIRAGHIACNLTTHAAITAAYTEAQRPTATPAAVAFTG